MMEHVLVCNMDVYVTRKDVTKLFAPESERRLFAPESERPPDSNQKSPETIFSM
jgi:hypothetical protein